MRKVFLVLISALLIGLVSIEARAEQSTSTFTGKRYEEQQVFVYAYNNSGADVESNSVVILDITATGNSTLGTYFTTSATSGSSYIMGITDETITDGSVGKICVRGPHIAMFDSAPSAADSITNDNAAGAKATTATSTANKYGYVGTALKASASGDGDLFGAEYWWVWVNPTIQ